MCRQINQVHLTAFELQCVAAARNYIHENLHQTALCQRLVQANELSAYKLKAGFRQLFGMTLYQYILKCRMETAAQLLASTNLPLKAIAGRVGYANAKHFQTAFKKHFRQTPGQYRKGI